MQGQARRRLALGAASHAVRHHCQERHPLAHWRERVAVRQARLVDAHPLFQLADEKVVLIDLAHVAHVRHAVNVHLVVAGLAVGGDLAARSGRRHW
jgi:hypothetical protein